MCQNIDTRCVENVNTKEEFISFNSNPDNFQSLPKCYIMNLAVQIEAVSVLAQNWTLMSESLITGRTVLYQVRLVNTTIFSLRAILFPHITPLSYNEKKIIESDVLHTFVS